MAEWGLRFWVMLTLRSDGRRRMASIDPESGELSAKIRGHHVVVKGERPPLLATFHADIGALRERIRNQGLFLPRFPRRARTLRRAALSSRGDAVLRLRRQRRREARDEAADAGERGACRAGARPVHEHPWRRPRRRAGCGARRDRLEHGLGSDQPPALYLPQPQLGQPEIRRLRRLARRHLLSRPHGRHVRCRGGARESAGGLRRRDGGRQSALPRDRPRFLDRPQPAAHRRLHLLDALSAPGRPRPAARGLAGAAGQSRLVVGDARRQWRRDGGIRHLARRRRALSRHQAGGQGRVQHGQFADP